MAAPQSARWIVSAPFDLGWFFGGAAIGLLMAALCLFAGVPVLAVLWVWILGFDGPHMAAGYSRTFVDRQTRKLQPGLLAVSLLAFLAGPAALALNVLRGSPAPFQIFLGIAGIYAVHHVIRQHYGFLMLYRARNHDRADFQLDRACLYLGCWLPYLHFVLTHPRVRALLERPAVLSRWEVALASALWILWGSCCVAFTVRALLRARVTAGATLPKLAYFLVTMLMYGVSFFAIARREPIYAQASGPDQEFMLLFTVISVYHSTQYVGLVWLHNRNRYGGPSASRHGLAGVMSASLVRYLGACLLFSPVIYLAIACSTGLYPGCQLNFLDLPPPRAGLILWNHIGLCLWWGIALQHYYLDQKIWRLRADPALRDSLGLGRPPAALPETAR